MIYNHNGKEVDLTGPQFQLLNFMKDGWSLVWSNEPSDWRCRVVKKDSYLTIYAPTVKALVKKEIIKQDNEVPIGTFRLVEN